ncbi:MAG: hypothetical protein DWQ05_07350 [Calditrichaeota bacterium]|nr:MAG: hypothetical protein DWQ05_07350 [Calditrichota bacterium]
MKILKHPAKGKCNRPKKLHFEAKFFAIFRRFFCCSGKTPRNLINKFYIRLKHSLQKFDFPA